MEASTALVLGIIATVALALVLMGIVHLTIRVLRAMLLGVARLLRGGPGLDSAMPPCHAHRHGGRWAPEAANLRPICANTQCRCVNRAGARFCAQCGGRL